MLTVNLTSYRFCTLPLTYFDVQDIDFAEINRQLFRHKPHLNSEQHDSWNEWIQRLESDHAAMQQVQEYDEDIMAKFQLVPYRRANPY